MDEGDFPTAAQKDRSPDRDGDSKVAKPVAMQPVESRSLKRKYSTHDYNINLFRRVRIRKIPSYGSHRPNLCNPMTAKSEVKLLCLNQAGDGWIDEGMGLCYGYEAQVIKFNALDALGID